MAFPNAIFYLFLLLFQEENILKLQVNIVGIIKTRLDIHFRLSFLETSDHRLKSIEVFGQLYRWICEGVE